MIVHSEELSDLCPEDKIWKEEEFETPPHVGGSTEKERLSDGWTSG